MSKVIELERRIAELEERLARHEERTEPMSAEVMYNTAQAFIENNPQIWQSMVNIARSRAQQNKRVSMKRIIEDMRDQYSTVWQTEDFKFSNSVTAALARFLIQECPEVKGHIRLGRSKVDRFFKCSTE